jgi:hypothetical protein
MITGSVGFKTYRVGFMLNGSDRASGAGVRLGARLVCGGGLAGLSGPVAGPLKAERGMRERPGRLGLYRDSGPWRIENR